MKSNTLRPAALAIAALFAILFVESTPAQELPQATTENAGWTEMGTGSATGGGISDNHGYSYRSSLAIAPDGAPIVAWDDKSSGEYEIYVRSWNGSGWEELGTGSATGNGISNNSAISWYPSLAVAPDGTPIVAWEDWSDSDFEIYLRRWNGSAWVEMGTGSASGGGVSNNDRDSHHPSLAIAPDGMPIIAWEDGGGGDYEIYVKRWNGSAWVEMGTGSASGGGISNNSGASANPSLAIAPDGTPIIAWEDNSSDLDFDIYVLRWNGSAWVEMGAGSASGGVSGNSRDSQTPSLAIASDGTPIVAWEDESGGSKEIYVRRWNGSAWAEMGTGSASAGGISDDGESSLKPSLATASDGTALVAWGDNSSSVFEIYVLRWNGSAWVEMSTGSATFGGISNNGGASWDPSLAIAPDGTSVTAWGDNSGGNVEIYVQYHDGSLVPPPAPPPAGEIKLFLPTVLGLQ